MGLFDDVLEPSPKKKGGLFDDVLASQAPRRGPTADEMDEVADLIGVERRERPDASIGASFIRNIPRLGQLGANLLRAPATAARSVAGSLGIDVDTLPAASAALGVLEAPSRAMEDVTGDMDRVGYGTNPVNIGQVKASLTPSTAQSLGERARTLGTFVAHGMAGNVSEIVAAGAAPLAYVGAYADESTRERAANDGREGAPTLGDAAIGTGNAVAQVYLEKLGLGRILPGGAGRVATGGAAAIGRVARETAVQGAIEAGQEALDYSATRVGTETGATLGGAADAALAGALIGGPLGTVAQGAQEVLGGPVPADVDPSNAIAPEIIQAVNAGLAGDAVAPELAGEILTRNPEILTSPTAPAPVLDIAALERAGVSLGDVVASLTPAAPASPTPSNEGAGVAATPTIDWQAAAEALGIQPFALEPAAPVPAPPAPPAASTAQPAEPAVQPLPVATASVKPFPSAAPAPEPKLGKLYQRGNGKNNSSAQAMQLPDGTWRIRNRKAGQWQPWRQPTDKDGKVIDTFDPSPAFGYRETDMPGGAMTIDGVRIPVRRTEQAEKPDNYNPLLDLIASAGGISKADARRFGVDPAAMKARRGIRPLFSDKGVELDVLRERLIEDGYLPPEPQDAPPIYDHNDIWAVIEPALNGTPVGPMGDEGILQRMLARQEALDESTTADTDPDDDLASWYDDIEARASDSISPEDEAEAMSLNDLYRELAAAGVDLGTLIPADTETDGAYAARLWNRLSEARNGADQQAENGDSGAGLRGREGGAPVAVQDPGEGFRLAQPAAPAAAQEVAPAPSAGLFGAPSARDFIDAAGRARDARRNGDPGADSRMLAGDGELFAGARPEQASVPDEPLASVDGVPEGDELVALHNLSEENLLFADKMGGMPVPSIGITKVDTPFSGFGNITLIGRRDLAEPGAANPVFSGDAYTVRFPDLEWAKVPTKQAEAFLASFGESFGERDTGNLWDYMVNRPSRDRAIEEAQRSSTFMRAWLREQGETPAARAVEAVSPPSRAPWAEMPSWQTFVRERGVDAMRSARPDDAIWADISEAAKQALEEYVAREDADVRPMLRDAYLKNLVDADGSAFFASTNAGIDYVFKLERAKTDPSEDTYATALALRKQIGDERIAAFKKWAADKAASQFGEPTIKLRGRKVPMTLANVVEAMSSPRVRGREKSMTFGGGQVAAANHKQYKSLAEIQRDRSQIVGEQESRDAKQRSEQLLEEFRNLALSHYNGKNYRGEIDTWAGLDDSMRALAYAGRKPPTVATIRAGLARNNFDISMMDDEVFEAGVEALKAVRQTVREYFEAKPQRAVQLSEFAGAVVPMGISAEARAALDRAGVKVYEYDGTETNRATAVAALARSLNADGGDVLFQQEQSETLTDADLTPSEFASMQRQSIDRSRLDGEVSRGNGERDADGLGLRAAVDAVVGDSPVPILYVRGAAGLHGRVTRDYLQAIQSQEGRYGGGLKTAGLYVRGFESADGQPFTALFTDVAKTPERAAFTAAHEIAGHHGLRAMLGAGLDPALSLADQNPTVSAIADSMQRVRGIKRRNLAVEEALADLAGARATGDWGRIKEKHGVEVPLAIRNRVIAALDNFLRRLQALLNKRGTFSDGQVRQLLEGAWKAATKGAATVSVMDANGALQQVVFHGTPHTVDRFSLQKIGTGEGAQAYGWGMYFASSKDIAEHYRKTLSADREVSDDDLMDALWEAALAAEMPSFRKDGKILAGRMRTAYTREQFEQAWLEGDLTTDDFYRDVVDAAQRKFNGNLYRVDVPEDADLLDWDKPLSKQPEKVREALREWAESLDSDARAEFEALIAEDMTGGEFYRNVAEMDDFGSGMDAARGTSETLMEHGIPGLRYLDGTSRAKGEGSANYVIWDESAIGTPSSALESTEDQTQSEAFKRWFGKSAVVDADGLPLVVYRGSRNEVSDFTRNTKAVNEVDRKRLGAYFTGNKRFAAMYGDNITSAYLSLQNPLDIAGLSSRDAIDKLPVADDLKRELRAGFRGTKDANEHYGILESLIGRGFRESLEAAGFDGVKYTEGYGDSYIAFRPNQIKSATANNGNFDPSNPSILASAEPAPLDAATASGASVIRDGRLLSLIDAVKAAGGDLSAIRTAIQAQSVDALTRAIDGALDAMRPKPRVTGTKNAVTDAERQAAGRDPILREAVQSNEETVVRAMRELREDPTAGDEAVARLSRDGVEAISVADEAILLVHKTDLLNKREAAAKKLADPNASEATKDAARQAWSEAEAKIAQLDLAASNAGREWGRFGQFRQRMMREDFTLVALERKERARLERPLTPEESATVKAMAAQIAELQEKLDRLQTRAKNSESEWAYETMTRRIERPRRAQDAISGLRQRAEDARRRLRATPGVQSRNRQSGAVISPTVFADLATIGAYHVANGAARLADWVDAMRADVGDWFDNLKADHSNIFTAAKREAEQPATADKFDATPAEVLEKIDLGNIGPKDVRKLIAAHVGAGLRGEAAVIDAAANDLGLAPDEVRVLFIQSVPRTEQSLSEAKQELADLRTLVRLQAEIDRLEAGLPKPKPGTRRVDSPAVADRKRELAELRQRMRPVRDPEGRYQEMRGKQITKRIAELQARIAAGDFAPRPRVPRALSDANQRAMYELDKAKESFLRHQFEDNLRKRTPLGKAFGLVGDTFNLARAMMTSFDLSAILRQGGFIAYGHPLRAISSIGPSLKAFVSEANEHALNTEITSRRNAPLYKKYGLQLTGIGAGPLTQIEEAYASRWLSKLPWWTGGGLVRGSGRAYVAFLNKLRADSFDAMVATLALRSVPTEAEGKAIANYINVATGRGKVGLRREDAAQALNTVFFAPRLVASRFQLLAGQPLYGGTARTRKLVTQEYARFAVGVSVTLALTAFAMGEDDDEADKPLIGLDPRSADFLKIRVGRTYIDPMAGLAQVSTFLAREITGETVTGKGAVKPLRTGYTLTDLRRALGSDIPAHEMGKDGRLPFGSGSAADVLGRFLRTKLAPVPGAIVNVASGSNAIGDPVTPATAAVEMVTPMSFQNIAEVMGEHGIPKGTAITTLGLLGMGIQHRIQSNAQEFADFTDGLDSVRTDVKERLKAVPVEQWPAEMEALRKEYGPAMEGLELQVYKQDGKYGAAGEPKRDADGNPVLKSNRIADDYREASGATDAEQVHHVIPDNLARHHPLMARARSAGYDLDRASNLLNMPKKADGGDIAHRTSHPDYDAEVFALLQAAEKRLKKAHGSLKDAPKPAVLEEVRKIEAEMRGRIQRKDVPTKNGRLAAVNGEEQAAA